MPPGGGPEKLVVLMEGEALLNDASGEACACAAPSCQCRLSFLPAPGCMADVSRASQCGCTIKGPPTGRSLLWGPPARDRLALAQCFLPGFLPSMCLAAIALFDSLLHLRCSHQLRCCPCMSCPAAITLFEVFLHLLADYSPSTGVPSVWGSIPVIIEDTLK